MLSLAPLASPDYYLGAAGSSGEAFHYFADGVRQDQPHTESDPLQRHGRWLGELSTEIGLNVRAGASHNQPLVTANDFESIYYGLHPTTGRPLRSDGKTKKAQIRDAKDRAVCKKNWREALVGLNRIRKEIKAAQVLGQDASLLEPQHVKCKQAFAIAEHSLRKAQQKSLRPGTDLVFSAPKTVSMQWAALTASGDADGARVVEMAHDRAVRETFARLQAKFVMTRKRDGNSQRSFETVQGVIACQWRHFDARPVEASGHAGPDGEAAALAGVPDPQLHDHINLFAPVKGADGLIYAAYTDYIRQNIKALGAMYRAHLSANLMEAGYQTERDAQKNGLFFTLSGIGRDQAKALSARAADIEALIDAGALARDAKLHSRKAKNSMTGAQVLDAWKQVFEALEVDPQAVKTATLADSIARDALSREIPDARLASFASRMSRERLADVRTDAQILTTLLEREAYFSMSDVRQLLWEDAQFVGHSGLRSAGLDGYVEQRTRRILQSKDLLKVMDPDSPADAGFMTGVNRFGEPVFTTHSLRAREVKLFGDTVPALLQTTGHAVDAAVAQTVIQTLEAKLSATRSAQGGRAFALRDFQLAAVLQAACGDGQLCVQIAGAGMGKTTSAQFTKEILVSQGRTVMGVAPSNKAASGLGRELGIATSSIDRLLLDLEAGRQTLDRNTVIFVDEAGMAGFDLMERLMGWAVKTGAKLILTGDPEQLPAVARGNVLRKLTQMESLAATPSALLYLGRNLSDWNRISRQKDDWAKQASAYFAQGFVHEGLREYASRGCVHSSMTAQHLGEDVADAYVKDGAPTDRKLILATTNAQVKTLNSAVRERLRIAGKLHGAWKLPDSGLELSLGDRIVFKERVELGMTEQSAPRAKQIYALDAKKAIKAPASTANLTRNEFATVLSIARQADGSLDIQCQLDVPKADGKPNVISVNSRQLGDMDHAFATTVHRSQGMTVDSVIAVAGTFLSKELFYVMATRHRERLSLHMLESDRALVMVKAAQPITKLHSLDLVSLGRAKGQSTSGLWERLQASGEKFAAWMQKERARFESGVKNKISRAQEATTLLPQGHRPKPSAIVRQKAQQALANVQARFARPKVEAQWDYHR